MIRSLTLMWAALALVCGMALFFVKYQVQSLEGHLLTLDRTIRQDRVDIHVLHAEWAFLNDPKRLEDEAGRYLDLHPSTPDQYTSIAALPLRPPPIDTPGAEDVAPAQTNPWASFPAPKPGASAAMVSGTVPNGSAGYIPQAKLIRAGGSQ